jgi:integrase/recombinase XerD
MPITLNNECVFYRIKNETIRTSSLYQQHFNVLRLQGKADVTIDAYSRAVRRVAAFFDCSPDRLNQHHLRHFLSLVHSH